MTSQLFVVLQCFPGLSSNELQDPQSGSQGLVYRDLCLVVVDDVYFWALSPALQQTGRNFRFRFFADACSDFELRQVNYLSSIFYLKF